MSGGIRPLERRDIDEVTALYELVARSGSGTPPPGLAGHFEETFLDHPWADPDIPSLVYEEADGTIVGFISSQVRRMRFGDRMLRFGCSGHLVTLPEARTRAVGAFLMRAYMTGPQDLTFTDTASNVVRRIWESLGGERSLLGCLGWVRLFRPWHASADLMARHRPLGRAGTAAAPVLTALDAASVVVARRVFEPPGPIGSTDELTPEALAEHLPRLARSFPMRPAYDEDGFASWLLDAVEAVRSRGRLVKRLVRGQDGRARGWFIYYHQPDGIAQVLQVAGAERDIDDVLDHLLYAAWLDGAAGVQGRVEPHLFRSLGERRCMFHASGYLALIHGHDDRILHTIQSGRALLTRLEGEWWMGHHLEPFGASLNGSGR
jgi:hypothetical protein